MQEVRGLGVVGAQPLLQPGERFEYTSGASIATPVGTMRGSYQMVAADGTRFEAEIPVFTLSVPRAALTPCMSYFRFRGQVNQTMKAARRESENHLQIDEPHAHCFLRVDSTGPRLRARAGEMPGVPAAEATAGDGAL